MRRYPKKMLKTNCSRQTLSSVCTSRIGGPDRSIVFTRKKDEPANRDPGYVNRDIC